MLISASNPIQIYKLPSAASYSLPLNLASYPYTFNSKPKDPAVQFRPYYHIVKTTDQLAIEIVFDDTGHTFAIKGLYKDGTLWQSFDFAQLYDNQFKVVINLSPYAAALNNKMIFFIVTDETANQIIGITDLHSMQPNPKQTVLMTYFNDIEYDNVSQQSEMSIRIPGSFYEEEFPDETEPFETSNGSIVELSGETKEQRLLQVAHVPGDIHRKIKHILKMRDKFIEGLSWKYESVYEILKGSNPFYELRRGRVLLTLDGSVVRNVYSLTTTTTTTSTTSTTTTSTTTTTTTSTTTTSSTTTTTSSTTTTTTTTSSTTTTTTSTTTTTTAGVLNYSVSGSFLGPRQWDVSGNVVNITVTDGSPSNSDSEAYVGSSVLVTATKVNNGGIAEDSGGVTFQRNGVTQSTQTFNLGDPASKSFTVTGLNPGDTITVLISE